MSCLQCGQPIEWGRAHLGATLCHDCAPNATGPTLEYRLRQRIDTITDERDKALQELWDARADNEDMERKLHNRGRAERELRKSREMWRGRARDAERMLNDSHRRQKARAA